MQVSDTAPLPPTPLKLLLVVGDAASPASKDTGRKALMESWGYTVTLIDDGNTQANFDAAASAADVVYVSGTIDGSTLANKLTGSPTPIVNEFPGTLDNFGFSDSTNSTVTSKAFTMTDAAHYITEPFSGAAVDVFGNAQFMPVPSGALAPGLQTAGEVSGTPALVTLDTGAMRWDGNPATARRAHLPFASAETADLTSFGGTILQRALEWAAGANGAGGGPPPTTGVVFEAFTDASLGNNGKALDIGKPGGTTAGDLLIAAIATDGKHDSGISPPVGWNLINDADENEEVTLAVWWKLAGAGEPAQYHFTWPEDQEAYGWIYALHRP